MPCHRCKGLMVDDWVSDRFEDLPVWRCINCGFILYLPERRVHVVVQPAAQRQAV